MSSNSDTNIAKKARTKAEADFATWLMIAKLGGFDDLPSNAQSVLTNYHRRRHCDHHDAHKREPESPHPLDVTALAAS
jgi:hypothetical protein